MNQFSEHAVPSDAASPEREPTDFLAFSRQYASEMGLAPDITLWEPGEFQAFLDWWLLRTRRHFVVGDSP